MWMAHLAGGTTVMSINMEGFEQKVAEANFTDWHFLTDD
jgi:hypothetical protein